MEACMGPHTEVTRRSPSSTSRSLRLSNSFLTWVRSRGRDEPLELRAAEAASRVSSRAGRGVSAVVGALGMFRGAYHFQEETISWLSTPWRAAGVAPSGGSETALKLRALVGRNRD